MSAAAPRLLCLGEALVDLIGEQWVDSIGDVGQFAPHRGGTAGNVAVVAARAGAPVALAGGAGLVLSGFYPPAAAAALGEAAQAAARACEHWGALD